MMFKGFDIDSAADGRRPFPRTAGLIERKEKERKEPVPEAPFNCSALPALNPVRATIDNIVPQLGAQI